MDKQQYEDLQKVIAADAEISVSQLPNPDQDRTLLWGYTSTRTSFHVYLYNSEIHVLGYSYDQDSIWHKHGASLPARDLRPDKRAYPEATDFDFARLMAQCDEKICFTTFQEDRKPEQFYGLRHDQLKPTPKELLRFGELSSKLSQAVRFIPFVELILAQPYSYNTLYDLEKALKERDIDPFMGHKDQEHAKRRLSLLFTQNPEDVFSRFEWANMSLESAIEDFKKLSGTLIDTAGKYNDTFCGLRESDAEELDKAYTDIEKTISEFMTLGAEIHSSEELFNWKR